MREKWESGKGREGGEGGREGGREDGQSRKGGEWEGDRERGVWSAMLHAGCNHLHLSPE